MTREFTRMNRDFNHNEPIDTGISYHLDGFDSDCVSLSIGGDMNFELGLHVDDFVDEWVCRNYKMQMRNSDAAEVEIEWVGFSEEVEYEILRTQHAVVTGGSVEEVLEDRVDIERTPWR